MQLNRIVAFHKAMADPNRVRIVTLLANGPLHGQAIAGKLGITPATISHHIQKLREINLIFERRDKNTIYFHLNESVVKQQANAIIRFLEKKEEGIAEVVDKNTDKQKTIENFLTKEGKLKNIPAQRKKKLIILEYMIRGIQSGKKYPEKELNEYIQKFHDDYATIRREFIINHYMYRENGIYELNPKEMWAKPE